MQTQSAPDTLLTLTENAIHRITNYSAKKPGTLFRVSVTAGGCSGFSYDFGFDSKQESDLVFNQNGVDVLVTPEAMGYLSGSVIDFVDDFKGTGFTVTNPNAKGTCGCGVSFSV